MRQPRSSDLTSVALMGVLSVGLAVGLLLTEPPVLAAQSNRGVGATGGARPARLGKYHALLIAVNDYADPALPKLDNPVRDADRLRDMLIRRYQFETPDVAVLRNPSRESITSSLWALSERLSPDDNLLIFFAGHGYWDESTQQGYWLPADAGRANPSRWMSNSDIRDLIRRIKTQHTLLITDACFAGGIFKTRNADLGAQTAMARLYALRSRKAMTSGAKGETVPDNSRFLEYLIKRLNENQQSLLPASELFTSLRAAVMNNSAVTPEYGTIFDSEDEGGEFLFPLREDTMAPVTPPPQPSSVAGRFEFVGGGFELARNATTGSVEPVTQGSNQSIVYLNLPSRYRSAGNITNFSVHPTNPRIAYASVLEPAGILATTDAGLTWTRIVWAGDWSGVYDFALIPATPDLLIATLWNPRSAPLSGASIWVLKTTDAGRTWQDLSRNPGLPAFQPEAKLWFVERMNLSKRVCLRVDQASSSAVYCSNDLGASWAPPR